MKSSDSQQLAADFRPPIPGTEDEVVINERFVVPDVGNQQQRSETARPVAAKPNPHMSLVEAGQPD
jgi:hypothetical protein